MVLSLDDNVFLSFCHVYNSQVVVGQRIDLGSVLASQDPFFGDRGGYVHFHFQIYKLVNEEKVPIEFILTGAQ